MVKMNTSTRYDPQMEAPRRAGDIWRLPSEEGQGDLRWKPRPTGEALSHPACAGLDVNDPLARCAKRRARHGDASRVENNHRARRRAFAPHFCASLLRLTAAAGDRSLSLVSSLESG